MSHDAPRGRGISETRKIAAILVSDVVGHSRLAGADEDRTLARFRTLRSDLIDPTISVHHGRIVKRTGDSSIIEFPNVVGAVRRAIEAQTSLIERRAGCRRIGITTLPVFTPHEDGRKPRLHPPCDVRH
jgi:class 3 adenylate cyclase